MKKTLLIGLSIVAMNNSFAQMGIPTAVQEQITKTVPTKLPTDAITKQVEKLNSIVKLSPEQITKVTAALTEKKASLAGVTTTDGAARKLATKEIRSTYKTKLASILNAEQLTKLKDAAAAKSTQKMETKAQQRVDNLDTIVEGLSDEQKETIKAQAIEKRTEIKKVIEENKNVTDKTTQREAIKTINKDYRKDVKNVLNDEQKAKLKEYAIAKGKNVQKTNTAAEKAQKNVDKLNGILNLNDDQKTKVYDAALVKNTSIKETKAKYKDVADKTAQNQAIKTANNDYRNQLKSILDKDQLKKLKTFRKAQRAQKKMGK